MLRSPPRWLGVLAVLALALAGSTGVARAQLGPFSPFEPVAPGQIEPQAVPIGPPQPIGPLPGQLTVSAGGPYSGTVGQPIPMVAQVGLGGRPPGTFVSVTWSFGDGTGGEGQTLTKTYSRPGVYTVTVTASVGVGQVATNSTTVTVSAPVFPLQVNPGGPYSGSVGQPIVFTGEAFGGTAAGPYNFRWSFGDGTVASGTSVSHVYSSPGQFTVTLSVTTPLGQSGSATTSALISPSVQPVQVSAGGPYSGNVGTPVFFGGSAAGAVNPQYSWSFGDGGSGLGQVTSHVYNAAGRYTATLTVNDLATGASASASAIVTIGGIAPPPSGSPGAFYGAAIAFDNFTNQTVLFGGCCGAGGASLGETWLWDGRAWSQASPAINPQGRSGAAIAYVPIWNQVILFGGLSCVGGSCSTIGDTWAWDGTNWTEQFPVAAPPARSDAMMTFDAARGVLVLFGGRDGNGNPLGDTWTYDGRTWTQRG
jgi:PKD repeat protein